MRVLLFGGGGFIGGAVLAEMAKAHHDVFAPTRLPDGDGSAIEGVDLRDVSSIEGVIRSFRPEIIINCAGIVDASQDFRLNVTYTENIFRAARAAGEAVKRIIVSGSAAEYGTVTTHRPISEDAPLHPLSEYGIAKRDEEMAARTLSKQYNIPAVVVRVFNPIGVGMADKFLTTRIRRQIDQLIRGERQVLEVSRLDALRDYVSVYDLAVGYRKIAEGVPRHEAYNIGSGRSTTNEDIINLMLEHSKISIKPPVVEAMTEPEPMVAHRADIARMWSDFGWKPQVSLSDTIEEIMHE